MTPLNQSRPHQLLILSEYFVDSDEYFYPIFLHWVVCFSICLATLMSTTSIYVAYIQHACGMFEIARYVRDIEMRQTNAKILHIQNFLLFRCKYITKTIFITHFYF